MINNSSNTCHYQIVDVECKKSVATGKIDPIKVASAIKKLDDYSVDLKPFSEKDLKSLILPNSNIDETNPGKFNILTLEPHKLRELRKFLLASTDPNQKISLEAINMNYSYASGKAGFIAVHSNTKHEYEDSAYLEQCITKNEPIQFSISLASLVDVLLEEEVNSINNDYKKVMEELLINLENDVEVKNRFLSYTKQILCIAGTFTVGVPIAGAVVAASVARVIFDNIAALPLMRFGDLLTVDGEPQSMLSQQGKDRVKKEIQRNPENAKVYNIKVENPVLYSASSLVNLTTKTISSASPALKSFQQGKVKKLISDCDKFNYYHARRALNFAKDHSDQTLDLLTIMGADVYEGSSPELPYNLDDFIARYLSDKSFAANIESWGDMKTRALGDYMHHKLNIIFQERHESEPNYINAYPAFQRILNASNGPSVINNFFKNEKVFKKESFLKRFLPAIREYQSHGSKTEDYLIYETILNHKSIDPYVRAKLESFTDIPKSILNNENFPDDLIVKLKSEPKLVWASRLFDSQRYNESMSEFWDYAKSLKNTEQFFLAAKLMPEEFKKDIFFMKEFVQEINNKFEHHKIALKANIHKTEREASMFSNQEPVDAPEYDKSYDLDYSANKERIRHRKVNVNNWSLKFDWDDTEITKIFKELNLVSAEKEFRKLLHGTMYHLRNSNLNKLDSFRVEQCLDTVFELEKFLPAKYVGDLIKSGKLNENSQKKVNKFVCGRGPYYQALLLSTFDIDKNFSNTLRSITSGLNNSKQLKLLEEKLKLFDIAESSYKPIFAERISNPDFKLLSATESKDKFLMTYIADENAILPNDLLTVTRRDIETSEKSELETQFSQIVDNSEPVPVFSINLDKTNGNLKLKIINKNFNLELNGEELGHDHGESQIFELKIGDFISFDNNGSKDLYLVGRDKRGPVLTVVSRGKEELYGLLLELASSGEHYKGVKELSRLAGALSKDHSGALLTTILNNLETIKENDSITYIWTGDAYSGESGLQGPCPHLMTYTSKLRGVFEHHGKLFNNPTGRYASLMRQDNSFFTVLGSFTLNSRDDEDGIVGIDRRRSNYLLEAEEGSLSMLALNGARHSGLLSPESSQELHEKDEAKSKRQDSTLAYCVKEAVKESIIQKKAALKKIEEAKNTHELLSSLIDYERLDSTKNIGNLINLEELGEKYKRGEIPDKQTYLAKEIGLPSVGPKLAKKLEALGIHGVTDREKDFASDKRKIFEAFEIFNNLSPGSDNAEAELVRISELIDHCFNFRATLRYIYPTLAAEEKVCTNEFKPLIYALHRPGLDESQQTIDTATYKQIREDFTQKDHFDQVEFIARVNFFQRKLDVSDLLEETLSRAKDSDAFKKIYDEFKLYDLDDDLLRESMAKVLLKNDENFKWHLSEEDKEKVFASLVTPGQQIYMPESQLLFEKEQLQENGNSNYRLYIHRDSEKKFLGAIEYAPHSGALEYIPTALCDEENAIKEKAYINGFEIEGTHKMKMVAGDILQLADDTYFVSKLKDGSLGLTCIAKGDARMIKNLFFDKFKLSAEQGKMPECAYAALIQILISDVSGAGKRNVFEGIGFGYCYNGELVARVRINNLKYIKGVPCWKRRLPVNNSMTGMNSERDENGKYKFTVEYPYIVPMGFMEPDKFFIMVPTNYYHGGYKQGAAGCSIYGNFVKTYINGGAEGSQLPSFIYGKGYRANVPTPEEIIHTLWEDRVVEDKQEDLLELAASKDSESTVEEYAGIKEEKRNVSKTYSLHLDEIKYGLRKASVKYDPSFAESPELMKSMREAMSVVAQFIGFTANYVGSDKKIYQAKLRRLEKIIHNYEENGDLDMNEIKSLFSLNLSKKQQDKVGSEYLSIVQSIEHNILRQMEKDLKSEFNDDMEVHITGTKRGDEEFAEKLEELSSSGQVNTLRVDYNRHVTKMPMPFPLLPHAFICTPRRTLTSFLWRVHQYLIHEASAEQGTVRIKDSTIIDKTFGSKYLNSHYKFDVHCWDVSQEDIDRTIIKFN